MVKPHRRYSQKLPSFVLKVARNNSSKSCAGNSNHDKLLESQSYAIPVRRPPSSKLLSSSDFPGIAIAQRDRFPLKIGKGVTGK